MRAAFVEEHAAFLVNQSLQELQFCFSQLNLGSGESSHGVRERRTVSKGRTRLPDGSDGFRDLLEAFVFGTLQELGNIQKNDEAAFEFADAGHVTGFAFGKNGSWRFNIRRRNFQHFGSRVDNQADEFVLEFDDENAILFVGLNLGLAEALAQVHHGDNLAAKIDHAFDQVRSAGDRSDFRNADDLAHGGDTHAVRFVPYPETDDLKVFFHQRVSGPLGTRQFGVFEILVALFLRAAALATLVSPARALLGGAVEHKTVHGIEQIARELQHLLGGSRKLRGAGSRLLNEFAHLVHGANDGLRAGSLFFDGGIDFLRDFGEAAGSLGNLRGAHGLLVGGGADFLRELVDFGDHVGNFVQGGPEFVAEV